MIHFTYFTRRHLGFGTLWRFFVDWLLGVFRGWHYFPLLTWYLSQSRLHVRVSATVPPDIRFDGEAFSSEGEVIHGR